MKKRRKLRLAAVLLAAMALLCGSCLTVRAQQIGSLKVDFSYANGSGHAQDGSVLLYQVAVLLPDTNGDETYVLTEDFIDCGFLPADVNDEMNHDLAAGLAAWIDEQGEITGTAYAVDPEEGTVSIEDLVQGLYLLTQQEDSTKSYAFSPFLVTIPYEGNNNVDASPKVEVTTLASETPSPSATPQASVTPKPTVSPIEKPHVTYSPRASISPRAQTPENSDSLVQPSEVKAASMLPQTGQLFWPIPFLTGGGLLFLVLGCFLRRKGSRKKGSHAA